MYTIWAWTNGYDVMMHQLKWSHSLKYSPMVIVVTIIWFRIFYSIDVKILFTIRKPMRPMSLSARWQITTTPRTIMLSTIIFHWWQIIITWMDRTWRSNHQMTIPHIIPIRKRITITIIRHNGNKQPIQKLPSIPVISSVQYLAITKSKRWSKKKRRFILNDRANIAYKWNKKKSITYWLFKYFILLPVISVFLHFYFIDYFFYKRCLNKLT